MKWLLAILLAGALAAPAEAFVQYQTRLARAGSTSTKVEWKTDQPATHSIRWNVNKDLVCPTGSLAKVCGTKSFASSSSPYFSITGLSLDTDYWVELISTAGGVTLRSPLFTMSTRIRANYPLDILEEPRPSNHISYFSSRPDHMQWMFNIDEQVVTTLEYASVPDGGVDGTKTTKLLGHSHFDLYGLSPNTFYEIRAISVNQAGVSVTFPTVLYKTNPLPTGAP